MSNSYLYTVIQLLSGHNMGVYIGFVNRGFEIYGVRIFTGSNLFLRGVWGSSPKKMYKYEVL